MSIIPVIMSGGSGTRLWPLSRASKPKQFLPIGTERSLFKETLLRCRNPAFDPRPIVVGAESHRFLIADDLSDLGFAADILLEPAPRNTSAAVAAGCLQAMSRNPDALVLVMAADHHVADPAAFSAAVERAIPDAEAGYLVTFGIKPLRAATVYGYIRPGEKIINACAVEEFIEKPQAEQAAEFLAKGYLWNSGNFLFRADAFLRELEIHEPMILSSVRQALDMARPDLDFLLLDAGAFSDCPSISVDYAVMERTKKAAVLPVDYSWSDVGNWESVAELATPDAEGNTSVGTAFFQSSSHSFVHSIDRLTALVGVSNLLVVTTRDAVLVADRDSAPAVKDLVETIRRSKHPNADEALQIFRPWGNYERLDIDEGYQVKRITVKPGGVLSLQKHRHRAEHWVVVRGEAEVTVGDTVSTIGANESIYVPLGAVHRLANRGSEPLVLIEVQTGDYLGEDDIIRIEDVYSRE